jgi:hypothetical protein
MNARVKDKLLDMARRSQVTLSKADEVTPSHDAERHRHLGTCSPRSATSHALTHREARSGGEP